MQCRRVIDTPLLIALLAGVAAPYAAAAQAQTADPSDAFGEIVVTARKRPEPVQDIPISIDAFTQADLAAKHIVTIQDLKTVSPSVYIQADQFQQDTVNITIRGLRNYPSNNIQFDSATAVYIDGAYLARTQGLAGTLFDVDSVQVEKGPQGTLVGPQRHRRRDPLHHTGADSRLRRLSRFYRRGL